MIEIIVEFCQDNCNGMLPWVWNVYEDGKFVTGSSKPTKEEAINKARAVAKAYHARDFKELNRLAHM